MRCGTEAKSWLGVFRLASTRICSLYMLVVCDVQRATELSYSPAKNFMMTGASVVDFVDS